MLTTLRTGSLTLSSAQYRFDANKRLTIKLTTSGAHKLYGDVNITLANVKDINIYKADGSLSEDYFNNTFTFVRTGETTLEYQEMINSGVDQAAVFATLANNGSAITATAANGSLELQSGTYVFKLIQTSDSDFDSALISVQETNVFEDLDGRPELFDEDGDTTDYLSIDGIEMTFKSSALVSISSAGSDTNIPLLIMRGKNGQY